MAQLDNVAAVYPLTEAQKGLLYQMLLSETDGLYRTQSRDTITGPLNFDYFRKSLQRLVSRHESLRCLFLHEGLDEPAAVVRGQLDFAPREHDLRGMSGDAQLSKLNELATQSMEEKFSLDQAPLLRVTLARLGDEHCHLIFDIHHLIFDGWSSVLFFTELQSIYASLVSGKPVDLPQPGKYSEFAAQQAESKNDSLSNTWADKLGGFERPTSLQLVEPLNEGSEYHTDSSFNVSLNAVTTKKLNELARSARITFSTLIEAAWGLTLARYNNTDDVVVGITLNGRANNVQNHDRTFGMFASALPMRLQCARNTTVSKWLSDAQKEKAELTQSDKISMADIHIASELPAGVEIFDSLLVFQSFPDLGIMDEPPIKFTNDSIHENSPLPLLIDIFERRDLEFLVMYSHAVLPEGAARQLVKHYLLVLQSFADIEHPEQARLSDISMLDDDDRALLLTEFNQTRLQAEPTDTLHSLFLQQAEKSPGAPAVSDSVRAYTYQELATAALHVRDYLIACQVNSGDTVAVIFQRSVDVYPAMLGTMMAGALFVPIDPSYPANRQNNMLESSGAKVILTNSDTASVYDSADRRVVELDTQWGLISSALCVSSSKHARQAGAYVMFTSGSTGVAKGVIGSHSATLNRFDWMWQTYPYDPSEVVVQKTSLSFVDSIWELYGGLLQGIPTVILSDEIVKNAHQFVDSLEQFGVTRVVVLPSYLSVLLDSVENIASRLSVMKLCVVSGEPLSRNIAEQFLEDMPSCTLLNLYGSTEVSADVTGIEVDAENIAANMPVGRPISGCQVYVLDSTQQLMPPGAIGELGVTGRGLSLGYFGEEEGLNQEKFIDNPFGDGKLYLTGDLGRYLPSGIIEHRGRKDAQIKIRGFRIEPAEIEQTMARFDGIRAVLVNAPGDNKLHAYYRVKQGQTVNHVDLLQYLNERMPDYMVPQLLQELDEFPRLPNGKISRKDLPDPTTTVASKRVAPRSDTEKTVAAVWQKTLGGSEPSIYDNFVSSGGSSLSGMRFNARLFREFDKMVLPRMLLSANLAQIAAYLNPEDAIADDTAQLEVDLMEPFFFGDDEQRLFGMMHIPGTEVQPQAVLLCPSIGHEYMRLHRGFQLMAVDLARLGYHVLRFDWAGIGDSEGAPADVLLDTWHRNVSTAAEFLRIQSGCETITLVGARLGAPLMLDAGLENIDKIIMLDPVCLGTAYLAYLDGLHHYAMTNLDRYRYIQRKTNKWERFGYTYSEQLIDDLKAIDIAPLVENSTAEMYVVTTGEFSMLNDTGVDILISNIRITHHHVENIDLWSELDQAGYLAFLQPAVSQIVALIKG
ncbi:MAG: amino acid adenylation domain-containing protein [Granulosicoccaceae bacterium]